MKVKEKVVWLEYLKEYWWLILIICAIAIAAMVRRR